ncbi:MAG: DNA integrity scanning protein DisA nucleotide-binding domain protein [Syntrophobacteraceae bacterium]|nr:DNA integrity scanning protein DisA nucleotide-binding domain protein [Syntrophobacteraceae bacterium]
MDISYQLQSIFHIHEALSEGLTHFSGPSRAALLYSEKRDGPLRLYDPQNLLNGWAPLIEKIYLKCGTWRECESGILQAGLPGQTLPEKGLDLAGLVSRGGRAMPVFYQMWFTEEHSTLCSTGPTERWLEHAACLLAHDWANEEWFYTRNSYYVIREYAMHAIRDYVQDRLDVKFGLDRRIEVYPILDAVLGISKTREEGAWPRGTVVFIDPVKIESLRYMVRFPNPEKLRLSNHKLVRKLMLAVENSDRKLISDGQKIIGVTRGTLPECRLTADFRGGHGFLRISGKAVCSFSDGRFHSTNRKPKLVHLEELFLESPVLESRRHALFKIVSAIVERAGEQRHGATLVIDLNSAPISISGQKLEVPIDLCDETMLDLAKSLSKVDGALHIGADLRLHGFACLLDGKSIPGENRARGARFNSALRFSAAHENLIVVVVSSDRPVSVIHNGIDLSAGPDWGPLSQSAIQPPTIEEWLAGECEADQAMPSAVHTSSGAV